MSRSDGPDPQERCRKKISVRMVTIEHDRGRTSWPLREETKGGFQQDSAVRAIVVSLECVDLEAVPD